MWASRRRRSGGRRISAPRLPNNWIDRHLLHRPRPDASISVGRRVDSRRMSPKNPYTLRLTDGSRVPLARDPHDLLRNAGRYMTTRVHLPTLELAGRLVDELRIVDRCSDAQWSDIYLLDTLFEHDLVIALALEIVEQRRITLDADVLDALDGWTRRRRRPRGDAERFRSTIRRLRRLSDDRARDPDHAAAPRLSSMREMPWLRRELRRRSAAARPSALDRPR